MGNGHSGGITTLRPSERNQITQIMADGIGDRTPVISGVSCEGTLEGIDHDATLLRKLAASPSCLPDLNQ